MVTLVALFLLYTLVFWEQLEWRFGGGMGEDAFKERVLGGLSSADIAEITKFGDVAPLQNTVVVDFREGVVRRKYASPSVSTPWQMFKEAVFPGLVPPRPGGATHLSIRSPDGVHHIRVRDDIPRGPLTTSLRSLMERGATPFPTELDAREFLCERGISSNELLSVALTENDFCVREVSDTRHCWVYGAYVRKAVRDYYSKPVSGMFFVGVGDGRMADLPSDLCSSRE